MEVEGTKAQKRPREAELGEGVEVPAEAISASALEPAGQGQEEIQPRRIDPDLKSQGVDETDLQAFGCVQYVASADSEDFNAVTALRVGLLRSATKATEERVVSKRAFIALHMSKSAWKKFTNKPTTKELKRRKLEHPTGALPLITPADASSAQMTSLDPAAAPRRLRRAEKVLSERTQRFVLVLERPHDNHNQQAVLRTAECLGIQHVWIVKNVEQKQKKFVANRKITRGSDDWLSVREFQTTTECLMALREDGRQVWVTDLSKTAICLDEKVQIDIPKKVALVIGREADGCSQEMLAAADMRVFLPMYGFSDSFNLSVATALLLQRLFLVCPEARGDLPEDEKHQLRIKWYTQLAKDDEQRRNVYAQWVNNPPAPLDDIRPEERVPIVMKKVMKRITQKEEEVRKEFRERMTASTDPSSSTTTTTGVSSSSTTTSASGEEQQ